MIWNDTFKIIYICIKNNFFLYKPVFKTVCYFVKHQWFTQRKGTKLSLPQLSSSCCLVTLCKNYSQIGLQWKVIKTKTKLLLQLTAAGVCFKGAIKDPHLGKLFTQLRIIMKIWKWNLFKYTTLFLNLIILITKYWLNE